MAFDDILLQLRNCFCTTFPLLFPKLFGGSYKQVNTILIQYRIL